MAVEHCFEVVACHCFIFETAVRASKVQHSHGFESSLQKKIADR
jgi:hypothetical protein